MPERVSENTAREAVPYAEEISRLRSKQENATVPQPPIASKDVDTEVAQNGLTQMVAGALGAPAFDRVAAEYVDADVVEGESDGAPNL
jgi:hypothetical protein